MRTPRMLVRITAAALLSIATGAGLAQGDSDEELQKKLANPVPAPSFPLGLMIRE